MADTISIAPNQTLSVDAICLPGDVMLSGSCEFQQPTSATATVPLNDHPVVGGSHLWLCSAHNLNAVGITLKANVLCYDVP